jgi:hypothetical protein
MFSSNIILENKIVKNIFGISIVVRKYKNKLKTNILKLIRNLKSIKKKKEKK